jgi:hypothetical protein
MTGNEPGSDKAGKMEPASPEMSVPPRDDYDPAIDSYRSWQEVINELHDRMVAQLVADHDNRMPEDWIP